jgi:hypothetical protein
MQVFFYSEKFLRLEKKYLTNAENCVIKGLETLMKNGCNELFLESTRLVKAYNDSYKRIASEFGTEREIPY